MKDLETNQLDYILRSRTTTKEEIENVIGEIKKELEGEWQITDILERLPEDVEVIVNYTNCHAGKNIIFY